MRSHTRIVLQRYVPTLVYALFVAALVCSVFIVACGPQDPTTTPRQSQVAHYGAEVINVVTSVQTLVNDSTRAGLLPVDAAERVTDANQKLKDAGTKLSELLKQYDAVATLDARHLTEAQIELAIATFNQTLGDALNVKVEGAVASQIVALYGNAVKVVASLQGEIAKGWVQ